MASFVESVNILAGGLNDGSLQEAIDASNQIITQIIPVLPEILLADDNATIATTKASEASVSASNALVSEQNADASEAVAIAQAGIATTKAVEALASANSADADATTATTQAGIATTKAGEASVSASNASTSASQALTYRNEAEAFSASINPSELVHKTGDETIAGIKTFSSNPISSAAQSTAVNALTRKDYVDTKAPLLSPALTGTPTAPTPTAGDNSTKLATTAYVDSKPITPSVRQTVLSGAVDTNGFSAFGGSTGSTTVTTATTLVATCADGNSNRIGTVVNPSWTGLSTNGTMYLYLDISTDGTCTTGSTTLVPTYRWGGADVVTNLQNTFNIQEMKMKVGNGSTASQVYRVFVGEVTVASSVVSAIVWYALMGRYDSGLFPTAANTTYSKNHNIGIQAVKMLIRLADNINGTNDRWAQPLSVYSGFLGSASTRNSQSVLTLGTTSGYDIAGNGANPYYRMLCERGW